MRSILSFLVKTFVLVICSNLYIEANAHDCVQCRDDIGPSVHGSTGKWLSQNVPHRDWRCISIEDKGEALETCDMCEVEQIRYVHTMRHQGYLQDLEVGCICAGHMEGDLEATKNRDREIRSRAKRRSKWLSLKWEEIRDGAFYINTRPNQHDTKKHKIFINNTNRSGIKYTAKIDNIPLNAWYSTMDEAKYAAFDKIWPSKISIQD